MIEIKHKDTGVILYTIDAETLKDVDLRGTNLEGANLNGADLSDAQLVDVNLSFANLESADLFMADLSGANLTGANLARASLMATSLNSANLREANLFDVRFNGAGLPGAELFGAQLHGTRFSECYLEGAKFRGSKMAFAHFHNCPDLSEVVGLTDVEHHGPSSLDAMTLRACVRSLPNVFLRGIGYSVEEIETFRALYGTGWSYYSCFISYARADNEFTDRLHADLERAGVQCWRDVEDMRGGQKWEDQINKQIKLHDKLVLICSRRSVYRDAVVAEIIQAINLERTTGETKLFPLRLDDHILSADMEELAREKVIDKQWSENWVRYVKKYHVPNFANWQDHNVYKQEFDKLLRDLKNPEKR